MRVTRREYARRSGCPPRSSRDERARRALLPGLDRGPPGERLRPHAPAAREDARLSRRLRGLLPRLRVHRRPADRLLRLRHEGRVGARRCSPRCARAWCRWCAPSRPARRPTTPACTSASPEADQLAFGLAVIRRYGYDFERGRQDKTHHPFMTKFSLGDVRITTRVREDDLTDALFSTLHECGHALYEQGIAPRYEGLPLAEGASAGVHESQSRLWENLVGRSRGFWEHFYPRCRPPSRRSWAGAARHLLPRHQQGRALADPHRRRRGHLQPARHAALRPRAGPARGPARREGPARRLARAHEGGPRPRAARRPRRRAAGRALVRG